MGRWLYRLSRSPARGFTTLAAAFCFGVLIGPLFLSLEKGMLVLCLGFLATVFFLRSSPLRFVLMVIAALFVGMVRVQEADLARQAQAWETVFGQEVRVQGRVRGEVETRGSGKQFEIDHVVVRDQPLDGAIHVRGATDRLLAHGADVMFVCRVEKPEPIETFRYDQYLMSQGVFALCERPKHLDVRGSRVGILGQLFSVKVAIVARLGKIFPEPHASFLSGLVFGGSSTLSPELRDAFARTGTAHILAASGFNVSLITLVLLRFLLQTRLGRRRTVILTASLLVVYTLMAGATASVVRAAIMAGVLLFGLLVKRRADMLNLLLLAGVALLFWNPHQLLYDVGFQLSFAATAALLYVAPRMTEWFVFLPERFGLRESFVASLAATLVTAPILFWHFGTLSLISPLVNLVILPFIPSVMAGTFGVLVVSVLSTRLALLFALPVWLLSSFQLFITQQFSAFPFAQISSSHTHIFASVSAGILITFLVWLSKRPDPDHGV